MWLFPFPALVFPKNREIPGNSREVIFGNSQIGTTLPISPNRLIAPSNKFHCQAVRMSYSNSNAVLRSIAAKNSQRSVFHWIRSRSSGYYGRRLRYIVCISATIISFNNWEIRIRVRYSSADDQCVQLRTWVPQTLFAADKKYGSAIQSLLVIACLTSQHI